MMMMMMTTMIMMMMMMMMMMMAINTKKKKRRKKNKKKTIMLTIMLMMMLMSINRGLICAYRHSIAHMHIKWMIAHSGSRRVRSKLTSVDYSESSVQSFSNLLDKISR